MVFITCVVRSEMSAFLRWDVSKLEILNHSSLFMTWKAEMVRFKFYWDGSTQQDLLPLLSTKKSKKDAWCAWMGMLDQCELCWSGGIKQETKRKGERFYSVWNTKMRYVIIYVSMWHIFTLEHVWWMQTLVYWSHHVSRPLYHWWGEGCKLCQGQDWRVHSFIINYCIC